MNLEKVDTLGVSLINSDLATKAPSRPLGHIGSSQKALSLSSPSSDIDWVSPYTLPPLPALGPGSDQTTFLRSPEHLRQRAGSAAYYAAAWGSPYATPSPRRSPARGQAGARSEDLDAFSSPLQLRAPVQPTFEKPRHHNTHSDSTPGTSAKTRPFGRKPVRKPFSERPNWLSESEDSGSEVTTTQDRERTPTQRILGDWGTSPVDAVKARAPSTHQITDSVTTVTPNTFHARSNETVIPDPLTSSEAKKGPAGATYLLGSLFGREMASVDEKPLPDPPQTVPRHDTATEPPDTPVSPTRPRPMSMPLSQKPKRKVVWKGKTCIIALPLTDRETAGLPPLLTAQEVQSRLEQWVATGYDVDGFELSDLDGGVVVRGSGQSRPLFPDPGEVRAEQKLHQFHVFLPDQAEWDNWVNYLKEEKLRALGVTPSNSEPPPSTQSPFASSLSRVSSAYTGLVPSPPVAPSSAASSNPLRATSNPFIPSLGPSSAVVSPSSTAAGGGGSTSSPHYNGLPPNLHSYKKSLAHPIMPGRMTSPFDYPVSQSSSLSSGVRPSAQAFHLRQYSFSPNHPVPIQSLGEVLSPLSNQRENEVAASVALNMPHEQSRHQHPGLQAHTLQQAQQIGRHRVSPSISRRGESVSVPPEYSNVHHPRIEIAHPTPRSHRHNVSLALQREIDEAEAALHEQDSRSQIDAAENTSGPGGLRPHGSIAPDESLHDELPILKRPETISGADERSEIETNPSIAATPMLMDDKNPFANWQALSDAARSPSTAPNEAPPPASPLNEEAKDFDPRAGFSSSNFSFNGDSFRPLGMLRQKPAARPNKAAGARVVSASRLNADAPAFTPGSMSKPAQEPASFKFSSATFNVEAPEFNPAQSPTTNFKPSRGLSADTAAPVENSIFGNVVIDPHTSVTRRSSRGIAILRPPSQDGVDEESSSNEEDDGRAAAPTDRQKRARHSGSSGDRSAIFADSAPFNHTGILSEIVADAEAHGPPAEEPFSHPVDGWAYISAKETTSDEHPKESDGQQQNGEVPARQGSPFTSGDEKDAVKLSGARPPDLDEGEEKEEGTKQDAEQESPSPALRTLVSREHGGKPKSSLSALAKPFEFKPQISSPRVQTEPRPQKSSGLEASRYAHTLSPSQSPSLTTARRSSGPSELYQYVKEGEKLSMNETAAPAEESEKELPKSIADELDDKDKEQEGLGGDDLGEPQVHDEDVFTPRGRSADREDELVPSYEEIDAVMKQFENNPELGVERNDTPIQSTPLVDMHFEPGFRSDAPSPTSPQQGHHKAVQRHAPYAASYGLGIGVRRLNTAPEEVSDWGDVVLPEEGEKVQQRATFFDGHVNQLVDGIVSNRLGPLERTLQTIESSLANMASGLRSKHDRQSMSTDLKESDADDEDEYDAFEGFASYRARSPLAKRERRQDRIRTAVAEAMAPYVSDLSKPAQIDMSAVNAALAEMRQLAQQVPPAPQPHELKTVLEDVISHHPRLPDQQVQRDHEAKESKYKRRIDDLESMLQTAQERAADETLEREKLESEMAHLRQRLQMAEKEASQHRESSEQAQQNLEAFIREKEAYGDLKQDMEDLQLKNTALESTLQEYRMAGDQWREEVREERSRNKELTGTLQELGRQLEERSQTAHALRNKTDRLREQMAQVVQDLHSEQAEWRQREHDHLSQIALAEDALGRERQRREKLETERDALEKEHQSHMADKAVHDVLQQELSRLKDVVSQLEDGNRALQDKAFRLERELAHAIENKDAEVASATARLQVDLDSVKSQVDHIRSDSAAEMTRLQNQLHSAELDKEEQKAKHESQLAETVDAHTQALREAREKHDNALEQQHAAHEKKLNDLRERHTRALHNSSDDRYRLEHHLNEKLSLSEDKIKHLESKVADLEERLEITKSAARAAVEAATARGVNLPTPASSVVASPPQRATSASMQFVQGTEVPEKISPQALRESIMVLQDQLQNREQKIEQLEAELAAVDKEAPTKIKERDTEITWLRELLSVRIDDLEDIIQSLSQPDFDRDTVKDASIRLKANLQMEQQLKERPTAGLTTSFPSISSLSSYAQSPRSLPMAAAAAWGNWRKARETSIGALSELATNLGGQTPSKSTISSPAGLLSGIMTPPGTSQRTATPGETAVPPPTMRPLASVATVRKSSSEARPLRAYSSQPRALSSRQQDKRAESSPSESQPPPQPHPPSPHTPISKRPSLDLTTDVDDDASLLDGKESQSLEESPSAS